MTPEQKQAIQNYCDDLAAHDQWSYGITCAWITNHVNYDKPATLVNAPHRFIIECTLDDDREIRLGRSETGWTIEWGIPFTPVTFTA